MEGFILSPEEIQELKAAHKAAKSSKDVKSAYKINSVILLGTDWSLEEVSEALLLDKNTLSSYVQKYKKCGLSTLLKSFHQGSLRKMTEEQMSILLNELDHNVHLTTKSICAYVKSQFNIIYSIGGMTDLLHKEGYVYKKPKLVPANPDINAQEEFLRYYNNFMETKPESDAVFFVDAVHPVHNSMPAYGWFKKGTEKKLKSNSGRSRLNIHGAMNAETYETTILATENSIDSDTTIDLLKTLEKSHPLANTIFVILDNARYHYSKAVQAYLKNSKVKLIFQPPYSPELNLIERLWRLFKKSVLYNKFYEKFDDFKKACMSFFKNQDKRYDDIVSIMGDGLAALV